MAIVAFVLTLTVLVVTAQSIGSPPLLLIHKTKLGHTSTSARSSRPGKNGRPRAGPRLRHAPPAFRPPDSVSGAKPRTRFRPPPVASPALLKKKPKGGGSARKKERKKGKKKASGGKRAEPAAAAAALSEEPWSSRRVSWDGGTI
ncbi:hypothetical protein NL676_021130 [Syzygium grande]|nr:hypothetical protein NL676_021130 [Syzygium grande]